MIPIDIGYTMNFFLVITIGNLSLFFFSYPATLPKIFYIFPHSCIIRGLYYQFKACVEDSCIQKPQDIAIEHWAALVLPFVQFVVYFGLGIALGETQVTKKLRAMVEFRRQRAVLLDLKQEMDSQADQSIELSASKPTTVEHRGAGRLSLSNPSNEVSR